MGQAFDRDGNVLGEAYGDTKREVFDKLTSEFKDAHEIRIRSIGPEQPTQQIALSNDHPLMRAWGEYKLSASYANTLKWLTQGSPTQGECELWAAFAAVASR